MASDERDKHVAISTAQVDPAGPEARREALWGDVPRSLWNDWRWQLANRIRSASDLRRVLSLTEEEEAGIAVAASRFRVEITPYFACLMDPVDGACPIRRQVVPVGAEAFTTPSERLDPLAEAAHTPVPGLIHRYPDRVLLFPTLHCAAYCRFCTRSRIVGHLEETVPFGQLERAFEYIHAHGEIRDVLISGGDPLTIGDTRLEYVIARVRAIRHVELVRLGTRVPVFLPQRVTPSLTDMLKRYHPLFISLHVNHPKEITSDLAVACERLADAGIPLGAQTVLLKDVNDDPATMKRLVHELLKIRVRPYYLYQCDPVVGTSHMRTKVAAGIRIIEELRGHTTGYAVPTFVIDAPGGGGKIPVGPEYLISSGGGRILLRNYRGEIFEYIEEDVADSRSLFKDSP